MILFASTGSWGEVSPLLALAIENKGKLACGPEWIGLASHYDVPLHVIGRRMALDSTIAGFVKALDMDQLMMDLWNASEGCSAIVSAFFLWPAQIVAELRGVPYLATTVSPIYFGETDVDLSEKRADLARIRTRCGLKEAQSCHVIGLYPEFLHAGDIDRIGYPRLEGLSDESPRGDYCLVSCGSVNPDWRNDAEIACDLLGLRCEYMSGSTWNINHAAAMRNAKAAIIHGGLGTLVDAIDARMPIIVKPVAYDQIYNARKLVNRGAGHWPQLRPGVVDIELEPNELVHERFTSCLKTLGMS